MTGAYSQVLLKEVACEGQNLYNAHRRKSTEKIDVRMSKSDGHTTVSNLKAPPVYKVIVIQFFTSVVAALASYLLVDSVAAISALLGGLICTLPNGYFARKAFQYRGARHAQQIVKGFYTGETGKLIMTAVLFALVFAGVRPLNELAVLIGFIVTIIAGLIGTAFVNFSRAK